MRFALFGFALAACSDPAPPATPTTQEPPPMKACSMEAKLCPDGSSVGREGPNCEFAACPGGAVTTPTAGNDAPAACKNECGNGSCQEMVCQAVGCPCSETKQSCPQDCK
jgi:hypothetical protein